MYQDLRTFGIWSDISVSLDQDNSRDNKEIIKKIYLKQKEDPLKGDWFETLLSDFTTIKEELNDESISKIPKDQYRKSIKEKVSCEAFECFLKLKDKSKKKMKELNYTKF